MLTVTGDLVQLIQYARETDSLDSLIRSLAYLQTYGDSSGWRVKMNIEGRPGQPEGAVIFQGPEYEREGELLPGMTIIGGLVKHSDNTWGIHT